jgi:hypothetical protein
MLGVNVFVQRQRNRSLRNRQATWPKAVTLQTCASRRVRTRIRPNHEPLRPAHNTQNYGREVGAMGGVAAAAKRGAPGQVGVHWASSCGGGGNGGGAMSAGTCWSPPAGPVAAAASAAAAAVRGARRQARSLPFRRPKVNLRHAQGLRRRRDALGRSESDSESGDPPDCGPAVAAREVGAAC